MQLGRIKLISIGQLLVKNVFIDRLEHIISEKSVIFCFTYAIKDNEIPTCFKCLMGDVRNFLKAVKLLLMQ